jgi:hypothetical protein
MRSAPPQFGVSKGSGHALAGLQAVPHLGHPGAGVLACTQLVSCFKIIPDIAAL